MLFHQNKILRSVQCLPYEEPLPNLLILSPHLFHKHSLPLVQSNTRRYIPSSLISNYPEELHIRINLFSSLGVETLQIHKLALIPTVSLLTKQDMEFFPSFL